MTKTKTIKKSSRCWLSRFPAVAVTAILGFTLLGIVTWTATVQITSLAPKIPEYQHNIEMKLSSVNAYAVTLLRNITCTAQDMGETLSPTELVDKGVATENRLYSVRVVPSPTSPLQIFGGMFGKLLQVLGTTGIVIVLVVFFLVQREDLRDRFIRLVGEGQVTLAFAHHFSESRQNYSWFHGTKTQRSMRSPIALVR